MRPRTNRGAQFASWAYPCCARRGWLVSTWGHCSPIRRVSDGRLGGGRARRGCRGAVAGWFIGPSVKRYPWRGFRGLNAGCERVRGQPLRRLAWRLLRASGRGAGLYTPALLC